MTIKLGTRVRDRITGFEGVATMRHFLLNGCEQYAIIGKQPEDQDKEAPSRITDIFNLSPVEGAEVLPSPYTDFGWCDLKLGEEVTDTVTGVSGILTERVEHINGCLWFVITPKADLKNLTEKTREPYVMAQRLKRKGKGILAALTAAVAKSAPTPEAVRTRGGPSRRGFDPARG